MSLETPCCIWGTALLARSEAKLGLGRYESAMRRKIIERSDNVLWSLSRKGIILHNLISGGYLELDQDGYRAWSFLDGAREVDDVLARCSDAEQADAHMKYKRRKILRIIGKLVEHGFAQEVRCERI